MVRDFCGHGLGRVFHDEPNMLHYGRRGEGVPLKPGMFFTIEPMINLGRPHVKMLSDGWTAVTRDRSLSAQFEHTVGVTETGCRDLHAVAEGAAPAALRRSAAERMTKGLGEGGPAALSRPSGAAARTFPKAGAEALADYELLELVLFRAIPRRDVKPLAKALLARFGSFAGVVSARPERLREIEAWARRRSSN